jgi:hypothetical protein
MPDNMTVTAKIGETGKVITVVLKDTDPDTGELAPKDLTGYTNLVMQVTKSNGTVVIAGAACVADADQSTNPGKITCTLNVTVAAHSGLVAGSHRLEFSGLNASGKRRYWPLSKNETRTYGKFIVQDALS